MHSLPYIVSLFGAFMEAAAANIPTHTPNAVSHGRLSKHNHCNITVFLWSAADTQGPMYSLAPARPYFEDYRPRQNGGGGLSSCRRSGCHILALRVYHTMLFPLYVKFRISSFRHQMREL
ncbi:hypothetical protein BDV23DRAFT_36162 [Aspergillus alliaceus]|uniref:Secreted protein n=1 Tax=Petromyces alliaceus TaxID=209559 RepID=A0A5N7BRN5_PETAA|nr:hypothetical protein BDV23DRAFT_36162 [Aspergillus alliaceus]